MAETTKTRPALSRPLVRYHDPYKELGSFEGDTPEKARRRRRRAYESEVEDRALDLIQNDPEVEGDMRKAKAKARELIALERSYERGELDVDKASKKGKDAPAKGGGAPRRKETSPRRERPSARRAARRKSGFVTKSVQMVAAPYGSVASAAWTFAMGALGVVIFYSLLQREGSGFVAAVVRAISSGLRNFTNPYTPLFPAAGESRPPGPQTKGIRRQPNGAINKVIRHEPWQPIRPGGAG